MKIIETQAVGRKPIDVRRFDQGTEAPDLRKADVIEQEYDNVWGVFIRLFVVRPPLFGILVAFGNYSAKSFNALGLDAIDYGNL